MVGDGTWACGDIGVNATAVANSTGSGSNITINIPLPVTGGVTTGSICQGMAVSSPTIPLGNTVSNTAFVTGVTQTGSSTNVTVNLPASASVASGDTVTFDGYWNTAHPPGTTGNGSANAPPGCFVDLGGTNLNGRSPISRDLVYNWELGQNPLGQNFTGDLSRSQERGNPTCTAPGTDPNNRRYIDVAVLNCKALVDLGYALNGHREDLPIADAAQFLFTNPVNSNATPIYGEFKKI